MAGLARTRPSAPRPIWRGVLTIAAVLGLLTCEGLIALAPAALHKNCTFPPRPAAPKKSQIAMDREKSGQKQMLVQATRDQLRLCQPSRLGCRQRPDLLRRLHARGRQGHLRSEDQAPARRRQRPAHRSRMARSPTARSWICRTIIATASSTRCASMPPIKPAWPLRAPSASSGNYTIFHNGVYTACAPCKDDPKKPPLWQVKAARIIHDQGEKMIYFEDARLEFFGQPIA